MDLLENVKNNPEPKIDYSPDRLQGVLKLAIEKSNWGKSEEGVYQGLSVYYCHNTHVAEVADITMENGVPHVKKVTCAVDCGIVVNPLGKSGALDQGRRIARIRHRDRRHRLQAHKELGIVRFIPDRSIQPLRNQPGFQNELNLLAHGILIRGQVSTEVTRDRHQPWR